MKEDLIKALYNSVVEENLELYKQLIINTKVTSKTSDYYKQVISLHNELSEYRQSILFSIMEQTIIDTISNVLGIIDGSSTLNGVNSELRLYVDGLDTDELQDGFLAYVENQKGK